MSVRVADAVIHIEGNSLVEDAEPLLAALQDRPDRTVDVSRATRLHSATIQILLMLRPVVSGVPADPFQAQHLTRLFDPGGDGGTKSG